MLYNNSIDTKQAIITNIMTYQADRRVYKEFCQMHECSTIKLNSDHAKIIANFHQTAIGLYPTLAGNLVVTLVNLYKCYGAQSITDVLEEAKRNQREDKEAKALEESMQVLNVQNHDSYDDGTLLITGAIGEDPFKIIKNPDLTAYYGCLYIDTKPYLYKNLGHEISQQFANMFRKKIDEAIANFNKVQYTKNDAGQLELFQAEDLQLQLF